MTSLNLRSATVLTLIAFLLATPARAKDDPLATAAEHFAKGDYTSAIQAAKHAGAPAADTAFFLGTTYSKLQEYDQAVPQFKKAIDAKYETTAPSLFYDYGQALFATHQLKEAEAAFKRSIVQQFKIGPSAYYVAFIRQLLEDYPAARDYYQRIQKLRSDPEKVKQPALYQLAEMENEQLSAQFKDDQARAKKLYQLALPLYKHARDFESGTPAHDQAEAKMKEIEQQFSALAARMRNGNPLPVKPYTLRVSQDFTYDTNVITQADEALVDVSNKDSLISKTGLLAKYQWNFADTFSLIPEFSSTATLHARRSTPRVYQNDNVVIAPALRGKYEHWSRGKPATGLADLDFNLMLRDYLQQHHLPFYSRFFNLMLGERVNWLSTGSTTFKIALKLYESYDPARNFYSPTVSFQQNFKIAGKWDLSNTLSADYLHARDDLNDEKNYKLRHSMTMTKFFQDVDVTPSLTVNLKDTMKQRGSRGTEVLVNPGVEFAKNFIEGLDTSFAYAYSKNYSKSKTAYQYSKHEFTVSAAHSF